MTTPILQIDLRDRRTGDTTRHTFNNYDASPIRLGRDPTCAVCLDDPTVSNHHAAIELDPTTAYLRDLGSTNGFHIAGRRAPKHAKVRLIGRIHVDIGPFHLEISHRPNPTRLATQGALPASAAPDLDALHAQLTRLHALHAPLVAARQAFETALADAALALADDPAATRRLRAEFPDHLPGLHLPDLSLGPSNLSLGPPSPLTPPNPSYPFAPDLTRPSTSDPASRSPVIDRPSPSDPASRSPVIDRPSPSDPASPSPVIDRPSPSDPSSPSPVIDRPSSADLSSRSPALDRSSAPDLSPRALNSASSARDLSRSSTPDPSPRSLSPDLSSRSLDPARPPAPDTPRSFANPTYDLSQAPAPLALLAPIARTLLPDERPPASADEARRFLDRLTRVLRDLAAGLAAVQHLRIQQLRGFDLVAGGPDNPLLTMTRGDELLPHLLAWRAPADTSAHELMDCFAVLLAHLRGHVHAAMTTACHFATNLAPPEIERHTSTRGLLRTHALWRTYRERYQSIVGDIASPILKDTFKNSYCAELAELGVHLTHRTG
jgi:hypothetical protein